MRYELDEREAVDKDLKEIITSSKTLICHAGVTGFHMEEGRRSVKEMTRIQKYRIHINVYRSNSASQLLLKNGNMFLNSRLIFLRDIFSHPPHTHFPSFHHRTICVCGGGGGDISKVGSMAGLT